MSFLKNLLSVAIVFSSLPAFAGGEQVEGVFKMYEKPFHTADESCDVYTELKIVKSGDTRTAILTPKLSATSECEVYIEEVSTEFTFYTNPEDNIDGCGTSVVELGYMDIENHKFYRAEFTDNRGRRCEDVRPMIVFSEYEEQSQTPFRTLYSGLN